MSTAPPNFNNDSQSTIGYVQGYGYGTNSIQGGMFTATLKELEAMNTKLKQLESINCNTRKSIDAKHQRRGKLGIDTTIKRKTK